MRYNILNYTALHCTALDCFSQQSTKLNWQQNTVIHCTSLHISLLTALQYSCLNHQQIPPHHAIILTSIHNGNGYFKMNQEILTFWNEKLLTGVPDINPKCQKATLALVLASIFLSQTLSPSPFTKIP